MNDFFFVQNYVDEIFRNQDEINHEVIAREFIEKLHAEFDNDRFEKLLTYSGYIPDLYPHDSSEETLFSKLIESLVCEWARRMGFHAELIKQKSSMEDIKITIGNDVIVCDAKSYRLGRSQAAPNAKDFLKLEDIRKWMQRYKNAKGGLITYPCTHEWESSSDIYQYCSTKDVPTVMLPYKYLAYILHYSYNFETDQLIKLWDYDDIFPERLYKNMQGGNKKAYWDKINSILLKITNTTIDDFNEYMENANNLIKKCVQANLEVIIKAKNDTVKRIRQEIEKEQDIDKLKKNFIDYKIKAETELFDELIARIKTFRLREKEK